MLALLAVLALGAWAEQTPVKYYYHNWESVPGTYRVTNYGGVCNEYKVLNSSTHTDGGNFGVGDNPEWDNGGYMWVVVEGDVNIKTLIVIGEEARKFETRMMNPEPVSREWVESMQRDYEFMSSRCVNCTF